MQVAQRNQQAAQEQVEKYSATHPSHVHSQQLSHVEQVPVQPDNCVCLRPNPRAAESACDCTAADGKACLATGGKSCNRALWKLSSMLQA